MLPNAAPKDESRHRAITQIEWQSGSISTIVATVFTAMAALQHSEVE
jgi:hypothetical protein